MTNYDLTIISGTVWPFCCLSRAISLFCKTASGGSSFTFTIRSVAASASTPVQDDAELARDASEAFAGRNRSTRNSHRVAHGTSLLLCPCTAQQRLGLAIGAMMDDKTKQEYEARARKVRADLKQWETAWAKANAGTKPGRDDIRNNPTIAQKYKDYNKLRDIISGKAVPTSADSSKSKLKAQKRKSDVVPTETETPPKRTKHVETPSKSSARASDGEMMNDSPAVCRKLFSPAPITSLGPTPQRDGKVLGLFDLLVERELGTPSKTAADGGKLGGCPSNLHATPSKRGSSLDGDDIERLGRTPMSASKRQMLNTFMTPLKNKNGQAMAGTPTSVSKLQFDTPAFLKRHSLPTVDEDVTFDAPAPLRLPRKPPVRGLSEIVASLRRVEDEKYDDDLEALHDVENDGSALGTPIPKYVPGEEILEPDSQARQLPLGAFDDEGAYDSPVEEGGRDRDGNPLRVFKKKGQKRTTRRVNMRPVRTKRPSNLAAEGGEVEEEEQEEDAIPDTQAGVGNPHMAREFDAGFEDEDDAPSKKAKKPLAKAAKEGVVKKAARKVNELAHANFQRLKLRNNGAKGGPGFNSRFRRRR